MKTNLLKLRRVLNATLFILMLNMVGMTKAFGQTQVATLQHNDTISAYYGMNALIEAVTAASDGDIIILSSGTFTATNITKAITLHGAGCTSNGLGVTPTFVSGGFSIGNHPGSINGASIEGICFQGDIIYAGELHNVTISKCFINTLKPSGSGSWTIYGSLYDVRFINCLVNNIEIMARNNNVEIYNSVLNTFFNSAIPNYGSSYVNIYNSIIILKNTMSNNGKLYLYNSIIGAPSGQTIEESSAYNCIEIDSVFSNSVQAFNCMQAESYSEVFNSFGGSFSFSADYNLKEDIATTFLGTDGREISIYGGAMPYDPRPSYLILNRCNVASKSTVDGKLSVEIEIISNE